MVPAIARESPQTNHMAKWEADEPLGMSPNFFIILFFNIFLFIIFLPDPDQAKN